MGRAIAWPSRRTRRPLIGESVRHFWSEPDLWRKQLNDVAERCRQGYAAYAVTSTRRTLRRWTLKDASRFDEMPAWKKLMTLPLDPRKEKFGEPRTRLELARAMAESKPIGGFSCTAPRLVAIQSAPPADEEVARATLARAHRRLGAISSASISVVHTVWPSRFS